MKKHCQDFIHNYSKRKEFYMQAFAQVGTKLLTKAAFFLCSSQKHTAPRGQRHPRLLIEECPLTYETLTNEVVKELLEKVREVFSSSPPIFISIICVGYI